jgi:hypothetical protein
MQKDGTLFGKNQGLGKGEKYNATNMDYLEQKLCIR